MLTLKSLGFDVKDATLSDGLRRLRDQGVRVSLEKLEQVTGVGGSEPLRPEHFVQAIRFTDVFDDQTAAVMNVLSQALPTATPDTLWAAPTKHSTWSVELRDLEDEPNAAVGETLLAAYATGALDRRQVERIAERPALALKLERARIERGLPPPSADAIAGGDRVSTQPTTARAQALLTLAQEGLTELSKRLEGLVRKEPGLTASEAYAAIERGAKNHAGLRALQQSRDGLLTQPDALLPLLNRGPPFGPALVLWLGADQSIAGELQQALFERAPKGDSAAARAALKAAEAALQAEATGQLDRAIAKHSRTGEAARVPDLIRALHSDPEVLSQPALGWLARDRRRPVDPDSLADPHVGSWVLRGLRNRPPSEWARATDLGWVEPVDAKQFRFWWERDHAGQDLSAVLAEFHRLETEENIYRDRPIGEDLGVRFSKARDALGERDVWINLGAHEASAERALLERTPAGKTPRVVSLDVYYPMDPSFETFLRDAQPKGYEYLGGRYLQAYSGDELAALRKPKAGAPASSEPNRVLVSDNFSPMAYAPDIHAVLGKVADLLPDGGEFHFNIEEADLFIERDGQRATLYEYLKALKGFEVASVLPGAHDVDITQFVLRRTAAPFRGPLLVTESMEPRGKPPDRRVRWVDING